MAKRVNNHVWGFPRREYLRLRIKEEMLLLDKEPEWEHAKTLSHMMIHVSKLNMEYVAGGIDRD